MLAALGAATGSAQQTHSRPWLNPELSAAVRAALALAQMTTDEKLSLLRSASANLAGPKRPTGLVQGIERLGIGPIRETNAGLGIAIPLEEDAPTSEDEAVALPAALATAASWDPELAYAAGAMIGEEARRKGFNVLLAGAANLARDPRNGRNFEYSGEDPLLSGTMVGAALRGIADRHVVSTMKHFALNDQETNRTLVDARIDRDALRESDLLAFEIANERGHPGAVMCAYNLVEGVHACENRWLLDRVLRRDWGFRGWVMSDWGAVHSTVPAALAGLDQESGVEWDSQVFYGAPLKVAFEQGALPTGRLDAMALHVLTALFAAGAVDHPPQPAPLDIDADSAVAERAAREGIVLLRNEGNLLPLTRSARRIAVIGGHADTGVMSGGGSSQVIPIGGPALRVPIPAQAAWMVFDPSPPLRAIAGKAPEAQVEYADGSNVTAAAESAQRADVAVVFATKWEAEGHDSDDLSLPHGQDALISAVAAANPRTIVVLETGNPVLMPWRDQVGAIIEAWYPGSRGGEAIADILFGDAEPGGRLPMTFPASPAQLPRPEILGRDNPWKHVFLVDYREGSAVGYRWFDARKLTPLYPFGFGLSYTHFRYADLRVEGGNGLGATFSVTNDGGRPGFAVPQLYVRAVAADGSMLQRLVAWRKLRLNPGETRTVTLTAEPRLVAYFDSERDGWRIDPGRYPVAVATAADSPVLQTTVWLNARTLPP